MLILKQFNVASFATLFTLVFSTSVLAQGELNCNVVIDASQIEMNSQDKEIINEAKTAITSFMNNRRWTADNFNPEERIRCNIAISITGLAGLGSYEATAQIQASRPVYGGSYESVLLNFVDRDFNFTYVQGGQMDFNENIYISNLTHMLGFYANVILAYDYDSFSKLGGTTYIDKVRNIAAIVPNPDGGWKPLVDPNNRAGLAENLNNQLINPVREAMYTYHRQILDNYQKAPHENHANVIEVLKVLQQFNNAKRPNAVFVKSFFNAKANELVGMFVQAAPDLKQKAVELMGEMDPSNTQKYEKILANN